MKRPRHLFSTAFFLVLVALTGCWLFRDVDFSSLVAALNKTRPLYIVAAAAMMAVFTCGEALKMRQSFSSLGQQVPFGKCLSFSFVGFYFNAITPSASGGQPAQLYYMKKDGIDLSYSTLSLLILALVHQLVMISYSLLMFFTHQKFIFSKLGIMTPLFLFGVLFNLLIFFLILLIIFSPTAASHCVYSILNLLEKLTLIKKPAQMRLKLEEQMEKYRQGASCLKTKPGSFFAVLFITIIQNTASFLVPYFIYKAFGLSGYSVLEIIAVQSVLNISVSSLPLPGAVGISENGFLLLFKNLFGAQLVFPAMLLCRGINFYSLLFLSGLVSFLFYFYLHHRSQKPTLN